MMAEKVVINAYPRGMADALENLAKDAESYGLPVYAACMLLAAEMMRKMADDLERVM